MSVAARAVAFAASPIAGVIFSFAWWFDGERVVLGRAWRSADRGLVA